MEDGASYLITTVTQSGMSVVTTGLAKQANQAVCRNFLFVNWLQGMGGMVTMDTLDKAAIAQVVVIAIGAGHELCIRIFCGLA